MKKYLTNALKVFKRSASNHTGHIHTCIHMQIARKTLQWVRMSLLRGKFENKIFSGCKVQKYTINVSVVAV